GIRDLFKMEYRPYKLLLELTEYCNSKCQTCYIWKNDGSPKQEINLKDLESVLRDYGSNLFWIALSGGEVTLYKNYDELIQLLKKHCSNLKIVTFTTNALKPQKALDCALKIKEAGYDLFVTISLDGDEATHDRVRGVQGNYKTAMQTQELLLQNKIFCHFGLTVSRFNLDYLKNLSVEKFRDYRAISFEHGGGIYKTETSEAEGFPVSAVERVNELYAARQFSDVVEAIYLKLAQIFFSDKKSALPLPCEVIATNLHISPRGEIKPCMYLPPLGRIEKDTISQVLKTTQAKALREQALKGQCEKCWMNCYAPHSIMRHPLLSIKKYLLVGKKQLEFKKS
ncbi:MAG: radical SAM/SPASM domain-containing protein, partial [Pseudobdellovibrio sp.]